MCLSYTYHKLGLVFFYWHLGANIDSKLVFGKYINIVFEWKHKYIFWTHWAYSFTKENKKGYREIFLKQMINIRKTITVFPKLDILWIDPVTDAEGVKKLLPV